MLLKLILIVIVFFIVVVVNHKVGPNCKVQVRTGLFASLCKCYGLHTQSHTLTQKDIQCTHIQNRALVGSVQGQRPIAS